MNRLWVRLTLAFALVILVTVSAIAVLADLTAGRAFRQYLSYSNVAGFQNLTALLVEYYEAHGTWDGVDDQGRPVSSGLYLIRMEGSGFSDTKKMSVLR